MRPVVGMLRIGGSASVEAVVAWGVSCAELSDGGNLSLGVFYDMRWEDQS